MLTTNKINTLLGFCLLFSGFSLSSCTFYQTFQVYPIINENLEFEISLHETVLVYDINLKNEYQFHQVYTENDSLKGVLYPAPPGRRHKHSEISFRKKQVSPFDPISTMHIYSSLENISPGPFGIPISDIHLVKIHVEDNQKSRTNAVKYAAGISAAVVTGGVIFVLTACNCPEVESFNEYDSQFHGNLFPGAIFKSKQRDDYLILDKLLFTKEGDLHLRVSNKLDEIQFIDQLELLEVEHTGFDKLGLSEENALVAYHDPKPPLLAYDGSLNEIENAFLGIDNTNFNFDNFHSFDELNQVILQFDRSVFSENPALVITGKQSEWLDTLGQFILYKGGRSYENWTERKDDSNPDKWDKKSSKRGLSLNVYLKVNGVWEYVGSHHDAGTSAIRNLVMALDVENVTSPIIEIKLESAFKIWEVDFVGLTNEWQTGLEMSPIEFDSVINQDGLNASAQICFADENYLVQTEGNSFVDLNIKAPRFGHTSTLVLHGSGYYHREPDLDNKMDPMFFLKLRNKLGIQDVSRALYQYINLYPELVVE